MLPIEAEEAYLPALGLISIVDRYAEALFLMSPLPERIRLEKSVKNTLSQRR